MPHDSKDRIPTSSTYSQQLAHNSYCIDPTVLKPCVQLSQILTQSCQPLLYDMFKKLWRSASFAWSRPSRLNTVSQFAALESLSTKSLSYQHIV